jgi:hypothetical protein
MDSLEHLQGLLGRGMSGPTSQNWRHDHGLFHRADECIWSTPGSVELSPAWFQQGHDASDPLLD